MSKKIPQRRKVSPLIDGAPFGENGEFIINLKVMQREADMDREKFLEDSGIKALQVTRELEMIEIIARRQE